MVEIADIVDRESLEAWLKGQPREVSVWIAYRAAMRVLPQWWNYVLTPAGSQKGDLTALPILRCNLISSVARTRPTDDINTAAATTATAAAATATATATAAAAANAAYAAYAAAATAAATTATTAAATTATAAATTATATAIWQLTRADCAVITSEADMDDLRLWGDQVNPLAEIWSSVKQQLPAAYSNESARGTDAVDWSFWVKWYDDALNGIPPNWDMLERIALIDPKDWDKGAERVNYLIGEIEKEFAPDVVPYADVITYDQQYHSEPRTELPAQTLEDARARINDVIEGLCKVGNQYPELGEEADLLSRTLERYPDRAIRLFEVCQKVIVHVGNHLATGVVPRDDNRVADAVVDLQNTADDIYNFDPEVKRVSDARDARRFERLSEAQREDVAIISEAVAQNSDAELADEMREDAAEVATESDPEGETKPARYRLGSRLTRIWALGGKGLKNVYQALDVVGTVGGGAGALWALIKFLIGF